MAMVDEQPKGNGATVNGESAASRAMMGRKRREQIFSKIEEFLPEMVAIRQDLHAHPELAYEEHRTSAIIAECLTNYGYKVTTGIGKTGVVGQMKCGDGPKTIGLRADFDALPMDELTNLPYRSKYEGKMHACGHDGHTAMLLTAARYLAETKNFNGTVNLIFQPAEEGHQGAKAMMEDGLFSRFPCDVIYAIHNRPGEEFGKIASRSGPFMPSSDTIEIAILGRGGHGANPQSTIDPITVGVQFVTALQTIVSRNIAPAAHAVVSVGSFKAGSACNIIPDRADLLLTVRCFSDEVRNLIEQRMKALAQYYAQAYGAEVEIGYHKIFPVLVNHEKETDYAMDLARDFYGEENVIIADNKSAGSEDFSFMLEERPGAYLVIGTGDGPALHNPHYDFNDKIIPYGAAYWAHLVEQYLR